MSVRVYLAVLLTTFAAVANAQRPREICCTIRNDGQHSTDTCLACNDEAECSRVYNHHLRTVHGYGGGTSRTGAFVPSARTDVLLVSSMAVTGYLLGDAIGTSKDAVDQPSRDHSAEAEFGAATGAFGAMLLVFTRHARMRNDTPLQQLKMAGLVTATTTTLGAAIGAGTGLGPADENGNRPKPQTGKARWPERLLARG